ncbi:MAG: hypothetical protein ACRC2H_01915 [Silanimonas sp.]
MRLSHRLSMVMLAAAFVSPLAASPPEPVPRTAEDRARGDELVRSVVTPALRAWLEDHREAWAPTDAEIDRMAVWMAAANRCPGRDPSPPIDPAVSRNLATALVAGPKQQRFLQRRFGGERVLFQQFGTEAFDATHRLILALEREGKIRFASAGDRTLALDYWTRDQGAWVSAYKNDEESLPQLYDAPPCPPK